MICFQCFNCEGVAFRMKLIVFLRRSVVSRVVRFRFSRFGVSGFWGVRFLVFKG